VSGTLHAGDAIPYGREIFVNCMSTIWSIDLKYRLPYSLIIFRRSETKSGRGGSFFGHVGVDRFVGRTGEGGCSGKEVIEDAWPVLILFLISMVQGICYKQ